MISGLGLGLKMGLGPGLGLGLGLEINWKMDYMAMCTCQLCARSKAISASRNVIIGCKCDC